MTEERVPKVVGHGPDRGGKAGSEWIRESGDLSARERRRYRAPPEVPRGRDDNKAVIEYLVGVGGRRRPEFEAVITLVLGGTRSGKSAVAERLAAQLPAPMTYVATAVADPDDSDLAARVAAHRRRRPPAWRTTEAADQLVAVVAALAGSILIDSLGTWVAATRDFDVDFMGLCNALSERSDDTVVVSDEVGLGVHPSTDVGRRFRDVLGEVNQAVASVADQVLLVVAGRSLLLSEI